MDAGQETGHGVSEGGEGPCKRRKIIARAKGRGEKKRNEKMS
jgi:hypothetical protein